MESIDDYWLPQEKAGVEHALAHAIVGDRETVRRCLAAFIKPTAADEILATAQIYDHAARLRSFEIVADVRRGLPKEALSGR